MSESFDADNDCLCMECGRSTRRIVIVWEGPLCSQECEDDWEADYITTCEATRLSSESSECSPADEIPF